MLKQDQNITISIPIHTFQYASILIFCYPIVVFFILFWFGSSVGETLSSILYYFAEHDPKFYLYQLSFVVTALGLWNIRLNITESKIYYSMLGIPTMWSIQRDEVLKSQLNQKYDSPYSYIKRKIKRFNNSECEKVFDCRYGTIEFIFHKTSLLNQFRHKFSLIYLSAFSKKQSVQIISALKQYWDLNIQPDP